MLHSIMNDSILSAECTSKWSTVRTSIRRQNLCAEKVKILLKATFNPFLLYLHTITLYGQCRHAASLCQTNIIHGTSEVSSSNKQQRLKCCVHLITKPISGSPPLQPLVLLAYNLNAESANNGEVSAAGWGQFWGRLGNTLCMCLCIL